MQSDILLIAFIFFIGFGAIIFFVKSELQKLSIKDDNASIIEWIKATQLAIDRQNRTLTEAMRGTSSDVTHTLQRNTRELNERLDTAAKVIGDLKRNLGEMAEVGKGIKSLQEFLQSPKLRGNIGEQVLSDMIGETFPKNAFYLQHTFRSGAKVDAVLKTDAGMLCIDAKFPMENFTRMHTGETESERSQAKKEFSSDVRKHIMDIAKKYILPEEGTLDFALMYIPSESVYYDVANNMILMAEARKSRVYPVSPNTLYAHLQVLLLSFQGKELEQKSQEVFRLLRAIQKDYGKVEEQLAILNKHVTNAYNSSNLVASSFTVLGQKLNQTHKIADHTKSEEAV